jgi:hypothetical protein
MAETLTKVPVLGDLLKDEQHNFLGREEGFYDNSVGTDPVPLGTVVQQGSGTLEPWDMSGVPDPEDLYGILLTDVGPGEEARVGVLIAGPAAIDPNFLVWDAPAADAKIAIGLDALKNRKFIFARKAIATGTFPEQIL